MEQFFQNQQLLITTVISVVFLSMFFSFAESSVGSVNEFKLKSLIKNKKKNRSAELFLKVIQNRTKYLSSIIFCNGIVNLVGSMVIGSLATNAFHDRFQYAVFTGTVAACLLLYSEIKPKSYATNNPEKVGCFLIRPLIAITWFLTPVIYIIHKIIGSKNVVQSFTICEIDSILSSASEVGVIHERESKLIKNVIGFREMLARDLIVRGKEIITVPIDATVTKTRSLACKSAHRRFIAVSKHNQPVGVVLKSDILVNLLDHQDHQVDTLIAQIVRPVLVVPEDKPMISLLERLYKTDSHLAVVTDDDNKMIGIVTLSSIQEAILNAK